MFHNRKSFAQMAEEALVKIKANQTKPRLADVIYLCEYRNTKKKVKGNA